MIRRSNIWATKVVTDERWIYFTKMITCWKYAQNNKIKRLTSKLFLNVFQFNDSFGPISCL